MLDEWFFFTPLIIRDPKCSMVEKADQYQIENFTIEWELVCLPRNFLIKKSGDHYVLCRYWPASEGYLFCPPKAQSFHLCQEPETTMSILINHPTCHLMTKINREPQIAREQKHQLDMNQFLTAPIIKVAGIYLLNVFHHDSFNFLNLSFYFCKLVNLVWVVCTVLHLLLQFGPTLRYIIEAATTTTIIKTIKEKKHTQYRSHHGGQNVHTVLTLTGIS